MLIGLCFITSTIHGNLLNTLAISTSLSLRITRFLTHSTPKALSSGYSLNNSSAGSGGGGLGGSFSLSTPLL